MRTAAPARLHHVALTVSDLEASRSWYEDVFGLKYVMDAPHEGGFAQLVANEDFSLVFALHRHDAHDGKAFLESRTGLDHVGMGVVGAAAAHRPPTPSANADEPYGSVLVFRDPDNIQLELFAPPSA